MTGSKKTLGNAKFLHKSIVGTLRIINIYKIGALVVVMLLAGAAFLFFVQDERMATKIGTLSTVTIAVILCWMQFSTYSKGIIKRRGEEAEEKCNSIIDGIKEYGYDDCSGVMEFDYWGKENSEMIATFGKKYYIVEWKFRYEKLSEICRFDVRIRRVNAKGTHYLTNYYESIMYKSEPFMWGVTSIRYVISNKSQEGEKEVYLKFENISDGDWDALLQAIGYILRDPKWRG